MPNLKHLLDDLEEMGVEPHKVRIPGQLYDSLIADAEESQDEDAQEQE
jgi:acyl CoA:acetate/3-ketoacid CoA transferase